MKCYQVLGWNDHFENNRSRQRKQCRFVCVPNKPGGWGLTRILSEPDGAAIYGIWCLILGACSRHEERDGWLTDTGRSPHGHQAGTPWAAQDLAIIWRRPVDEVERALAFLSSPAVGWMKVTAECTPSDSEVTAECTPSDSRVTSEGREGREGKEEYVPERPVAGSEPTPTLSAREQQIFDSLVSDISPVSPLTRTDAGELARRFSEDFPEMNCVQSIRACRRWMEDKPSRRSKKTSGTRRRLTTWLQKDDEDRKHRIPMSGSGPDLSSGAEWVEAWIRRAGDTLRSQELDSAPAAALKLISRAGGWHSLEVVYGRHGAEATIERFREDALL